MIEDEDLSLQPIQKNYGFNDNPGDLGDLGDPGDQLEQEEMPQESPEMMEYLIDIPDLSDDGGEFVISGKNWNK